MELIRPRPIDVGMLRVHLALVRPRQWAKSAIAVPIASLLLIDQLTLEAVGVLCLTTVLFVLASSSVYILNDYFDIERDRGHPTKRDRPLASGQVSRRAAILMVASLILAGVLLAPVVPFAVSALVGLYLGMNVLYTLRLKHVPVVELLIVATGFALRTAAGFFAISVTPAPFVLATIFATSLMMVVGKRRAEISELGTLSGYRPVLRHYSEGLLDAYLVISSIFAFCCGSAALFMIFSEQALTLLFSLSLPFLIFMVLYYLMRAFVGHSTASPTKMILTDRTVHFVIGLPPISTGQSGMIMEGSSLCLRTCLCPTRSITASR